MVIVKIIQKVLSETNLHVIVLGINIESAYSSFMMLMPYTNGKDIDLYFTWQITLHDQLAGVLLFMAMFTLSVGKHPLS